MFEVPLILAMPVSVYIRNQTNSKGYSKAINHVGDNIGILSLSLSLHTMNGMIQMLKMHC